MLVFDRKVSLENPAYFVSLTFAGGRVTGIHDFLYALRHGGRDPRAAGIAAEISPTRGHLRRALLPIGDGEIVTTRDVSNHET